MSEFGEVSKADYAMLEQHAQKLVEHFDSVQIFCTRNSPDLNGTVHIGYGRGNYFARLGQIRAWLIKEDEGFRVDIRENT